MKKLLALLLVAAMCVTLLAACAGSNNTTTTPENSTPDTTDTETPDTTETPDNTETPDAPETPEDEEDEEKEIVEINVWLWHGGTVEDAMVSVVEDAVNAITEETISTHVNLTYLPFGDYGTQLTLAISGGECIDVACTMPFGGALFGTLVANNQLTDITPYLSTTGKDIEALAGQYLGAGTVNGGIYAIPTLRSKGSRKYFCWNQEVTDELGITEQVQNMETWADLEAVMAAVDAATDLYAFGDNGWAQGNIDGFWDDEKIYVFQPDTLGDGNHILYLDDETMTVKKFSDNEQYVGMMKRLVEWFNAGYIYPDTPVSQIGSLELMKSNVVWANLCGSELGVETAKETESGKDIGVKEIGPGMLTSASFTMFSNVIPITSEEPEAGVAFMNELYRNGDLLDIIYYGIEGETYTVNADGTVTTGQGYFINEFEIGNSFVSKPIDSNGADFRELAKNDLETSLVSKALGFALNTEPLNDYIGALTGVNGEYFNSLQSGLYTDQLFEEYKSAIAAAGADDYVAGVQAQLDAWMAS